MQYYSASQCRHFRDYMSNKRRYFSVIISHLNAGILGLYVILMQVFQGLCIISLQVFQGLYVIGEEAHHGL